MKAKSSIAHIVDLHSLKKEAFRNTSHHTPPLCDDILLWAGKAQGYSLYVAVPGSAGRGDVRKIRRKCENFW